VPIEDEKERVQNCEVEKKEANSGKQEVDPCSRDVVVNQLCHIVPPVPQISKSRYAVIVLRKSGDRQIMLKTPSIAAEVARFRLRDGEWGYKSQFLFERAFEPMLDVSGLGERLVVLDLTSAREKPRAAA
jgi:hypothetical protein